MHGVQPIAKTTPRPNDASQPPRDVTRPPPMRCPTPSEPPGLARAIEPVVVASEAEAPASSGRQRALEEPDPQDAGEAEPHHDEHDATGAAEERHVVRKRAADERGRHAEDREHEAEADHVRDRMPHGEPPRGIAGGPAWTATTVSWPR